MKIKSPLTGTSNTSWLSDISATYIKQQYREQYNIDVAPFFEGLKDISIYKDNDTGYRFYYPFTVTGDDKFYEKLQELDWYYMPWKWEHQQATNYLTSKMKVLEVGCAQGSFLERIVREYQIDATGLELNKNAAETAKANGLNVLTETIQQHSKQYSSEYDLVCSFQVVEHIADVKSFIEAQVEVLKPGGKLVISVPNNRGFLGDDSRNILNMPPHHMGLWDKDTLKNIANFFSLKHEKCHYEPLQDYHKKYFKKTFLRRLAFRRNHYLSVLYYKLTNHPLTERLFLSSFNRKFKAFTIQAVYTKHG